MNERILKLAEQAGSTHKQSLGVYQFYTHELEKFVELIVRECAHLVGGYTKENEFGTDVKEAYEEITKHFGVEE